MGFKNAAQRKAVWASKNEQKKGSPAKHCASDMMHSGGWQEMRKHNSPGTIGNKAGIKHNEKMRQAIGTFKMPHSPLNRSMLDKEGNVKKRIEKKVNRILGDEMYIQNPTSKKDKRINKRIERRTDRANKFINKFDEVSPLNQGHKKLTADGPKIPENEAKAWADFKAGYMNRKEHMGKPITAEQNLAEYNREKTEFYYDRNKKKLKLIPTDDGEQKIMDGIEKNQLAPDRKSSMSPLNKEGKKDACYHKVKSRVKVWPSAYASGQLVQCRKAGAANWGEKSKKK